MSDEHARRTNQNNGDNSMADTGITVTEEARDALKNEKMPEESYSDTILRLVHDEEYEGPVTECFHIQLRKSCREDEIVTVEYADGEFSHDYCRFHAEQEVEKHEDAKIVGGRA